MVIKKYFIYYINMNINDFLNKKLLGLDSQKHNIDLLYFENNKISKISSKSKIPNNLLKIRIVIISDTHTLHNLIDIPSCHILIHCGDIALQGRVYSDSESLEYYTQFNKWLSKINSQYKIVIAGNHDYYLEKIGMTETQKVLSNCIYLQNSSITLFGLKIFGTPINIGKSKNKAFQSKQYFDKFLEELDKTPNINIIISHSNVIDPNILKKYDIKYHIWGHYHDQYGIYKQTYKNFNWTSICGCSLDGQYSYKYGPIIVDI